MLDTLYNEQSQTQSLSPNSDRACSTNQSILLDGVEQSQIGYVVSSLIF